MIVPAISLGHYLRLGRHIVVLGLGWLWPAIDSRAAVRRTAAFGSLACGLIGADYLGVRGTWSEQLTGSLYALALILPFVSGSLWLALGWKIYSLSRLASLGALGLYIGERAEVVGFRYFSGLPLMTTTELLTSALITVMLLNGVRATFANWRRHFVPIESA
ncbi:MAG TPA: hypothetical protein VKV28_11690 [Candidatus Binataceae bacterium]|nr:hypothetical protein [Candidatus Binataceae bacterium]